MANDMNSDISFGFRPRVITVEDEEALEQLSVSPSAISVDQFSSVVSNIKEDVHVVEKNPSFSARLSPNAILMKPRFSPSDESSEEANKELISYRQLNVLCDEVGNHEILKSSRDKKEACDLVPACNESSGVLADNIQNFGLVKEKEDFEVAIVYDYAPCQEVFDSLEDSSEEAVNVNAEVFSLVEKEEECFTKSTMEEFEDPVKSKATEDEVMLGSIIEDGCKGDFDQSENLDKESESERFLEVKKKLLLEELEAVLVPEVKTHVENVMFSQNSERAVKDSTKMMLADEKKIVNTDLHKLVQNEIENKNALRCSLKIEVVDETAIIKSVPMPDNGKRDEVGVPGPVKSMQRKEFVNAGKEMDGKKKKRLRRRENEVKSNRNEKLCDASGCETNVGGSKKTYSMKEMEALRFSNIVDQRNLWKGIYKAFVPAVAREYDELASFKQQKQIGVAFDPRERFVTKDETSRILRGACSESMGGEIAKLENVEAKNIAHLDPFHSHGDGNGGGSAFLEEESTVDDDTDEDYSSIQRPAFVVEGEPNFDLGPPEDGLEYLRRVRWEAAKIPKVKVAKVDTSILGKEQSVYMPNIPDIAKCPQHLLPLKQWEDAFLADFSDLRLVLAGLGAPDMDATEKPQSDLIHLYKIDSYQPPDNSVVIELPLLNAYIEDKLKPDNVRHMSSARESSSEYPSLSAILRMESVVRVTALKKRISSVENVSTLSRSDCMWLFALCAAVDTPLDADSYASLRSLLRKCASLRAGKIDLDDEVIMLNILATISGRFFGQSEN